MKTIYLAKHKELLRSYAHALRRQISQRNFLPKETSYLVDKVIAYGGSNKRSNDDGLWRIFPL
jgi:hypothetical protein